MIKFLNLSPGFRPFREAEEKTLTFNYHQFSGGEPHIKVDRFWNVDELFNIGDHQASLVSTVAISTRINNGDDFLLFALAVNALRSQGIKNIYAFIPYFPGARQDRLINKGEGVTVKMYANLFNSLNLDRVYIYDPHSDVTISSVDNCVPLTNHWLTRQVLKRLARKTEDTVLICPDAGARKKTELLYSENQKLVADVIFCNKKRNANGQIERIEVPDIDLTGKTCIIVDDICDRGGTFLGIAKELGRCNCKEVFLVVSHGIFPEDTLSRLSKKFDGIFTTNSIKDWNSDTYKYYYGIKPKLSVTPMNECIIWTGLYKSPQYTEHSVDA